MNWWIDSVVKAIKAVEAEDVSPKMQLEFYEKGKHPLDTQP
jgi:creatinine amidohydrolase